VRISYFNYHWEVDGAALGAVTQVRSIASSLVRLGHDVDLQFRNPRPNLPAQDPGRLSGLESFTWLRKYGHVPKLLLKNRRYLREETRLLGSFHPDVLLSVYSFCNFSGLNAAGRMRIPYVVFADAPMEYEYSLFYRQYYSYPALGRQLEGLVMRRADEIICISDILKGFLMRYGVEAEKIHVIPNGIDPEAFKPGDPDPEIQSAYNLKDRVVIGYIGNFQFFSDLPAFFDMVRHTCAENPEVVFFFVGEGAIGTQMQHMAAQGDLKDRMIFTASMIPHEQVPRYLSVMDIPISPYKNDHLFYNSSMKTLEYMAAGKPTVATALGQIKELIHDGCNGMLYEPEDYRALGAKVALLARDPELRRAMGAEARKTVRADWAWERQASRIACVLRKAVDSRNRARH
jgi:glycosyltransferase involved in cell wall biosynthesis